MDIIITIPESERETFAKVVRERVNVLERELFSLRQTLMTLEVAQSHGVVRWNGTAPSKEESVAIKEATWLEQAALVLRAKGQSMLPSEIAQVLILEYGSKVDLKELRKNISTHLSRRAELHDTVCRDTTKEKAGYYGLLEWNKNEQHKKSPQPTP